MKAIRIRQFGGPEVLNIEEIEKPTPIEEQVLVQIHAAGVNPVDTYIATGNYARKPLLPYTPGMDGAGIVAAVGSGVTRFKVGDRVYVENALSGTYAEFCLCDSPHVHPLPPTFTFSQGAALGVPYATAYVALFSRAQVQPGETLLIHGGSGAVGMAALQLAKMRGLKIIATAGTEKGLHLIQQEGADETLNHQDAHHWEHLAQLTQGHGVDVILEMAAHINLGKDLPLLAFRGRVVVIGSRGPVEINPRDIMGRNGSILAMSLLQTTRQENDQIHQALADHLKNQTIHPILNQELPLAQASQAHQEILRPGAYGKIALIP